MDAQIERAAVLRSLVGFAMDIPIKRAAILASIVGVVLLSLGLIQLDYIENTWRCIIDDGRPHWDGCTPTRWGAWLVASGLLFSFGFDHTVGPIWRWIRYGGANQTHPGAAQGAPPPKRHVVTREQMQKAIAAREQQEQDRADWATEQAHKRKG